MGYNTLMIRAVALSHSSRQPRHREGKQPIPLQAPCDHATILFFIFSTYLLNEITEDIQHFILR